MADTVPAKGGRTPRARRWTWVLAALAGLSVVAVLAAMDLFGGFVYERYEFQSERTELAEGRTLILMVYGSLTEYDSAGRHVERYGTPYRTSVFVRCDEPAETGCQRATEVREIGLTIIPRKGGATVNAPLSPVEVLPDSTTAGARGEVPLPSEEHVAVVTVRVETDAGVRTDTVRLPLLPIHHVEILSIADWFSRL
ncbi:hypothetical protein [Longimicrobium sp.]|uniref:hypothetical protein n=1 Tax=Longimicrobium sp. TaxID=2029185 RepID=UPI002E36A86E|nr:hypothetical protein [Longimicrobium sp.]HEX6037251.1 hypothetical protein [Longimicrobium sp.]